MRRVLAITLAMSGLLAAALPTLAAEPGAVILTYHRFGEQRHPSTNIGLEDFDAHLQHLEEGGYSVLPLPEVLRALAAGDPLPDRAIVITIDDAYQSIYTEAYPRLRKRGWPFTVFVACDGVDQGLPALLSWDRMREMQPHGVTFANHGSSHAHMLERAPDETDDAWLLRQRGDIEGCQERLQAELKQAPMLFAYPYGEYDATLATLVTSMGYIGFGQQSGAVGPRRDPRSLPRFPVAGTFAALNSFKVKVASLEMPVTAEEPWNPVTTEGRPVLEITVAPDTGGMDRLACFVSGHGQVPVKWREPGRTFIVQAEQPLPSGRSRYNCTAPAEDGRFYWFSHPWFRD
jgi:biofilm PGA synthesis lipoprotein PgaB